MIEKHQQTNGIGRGKITINPEYIKRAREITVGGLPIKILSSNPNTGRVLAQFPDGHTEEVKAAPDYFIGGNTSTKELKNNLPIYGETNTAANERADSLDEAHDLTPIFSNLITAGQISTMNEGALDLLNGKYLEGTTKLLSPAMFGSGIGGIAARSGIGGYNLFNKNGVRKTYNLFNLGHYGEGALSLLGDAFNAAMATEGLGSISNALKGTSGYRNWRLAREINLVIKNNKPKYTKVPSKNLFRTQVYKGGEITDPYSNFVTTDPLYAANYGEVTPYIFESKSIAKAKEPMMGSSDPVTMDMFIYNNTKGNPNTTAIIGHDKVTGEFTPSKGIEILNMNPKNLYSVRTSDSPTSLKFFERKPSRISFAERVGIPKGDRNLPFKSKQPIEHVLGNEAVKMFKEYGGEPIPEGSINGEQLRKYVAEARERYGLVGNNNVTDEEIALALYKHSKELGGNTAAVNVLGEPQLLFRGDTQRYTLLKKRISPEELAKKSGTMDNSLGNLFLGEFPNSYRGIDRYIGTWRNFNGSPKLVGSGTGSKVVWDGKTASEIEGYPYLGPLAGGGYKLYSRPHRYGYIDVYKLPASMMESGVNDLNAFIVRTPQMRNASSEISVLNDDWMLQGAKGSHFMSKNYKYNPKTYSMENVKTGESLGEITTESAPESRAAMGDHYKELLKEAEQKQLGLLKSEANAPLRDEHSLYSYFALPNFNIQGAKHLLPYDLRIPRNWKDKNIYRGLIPLTTGYTLYNIFNQPQLQYLKQGGKMNILEFLKNGSGIHIKPSLKGSFTKYCNGKVTNECIRRGKNSPNPKIRKKATFADNARHFKHKEGGKAFVNGVNVLDSNPKMYKYNKKYKMAQEGAKLTFWLQAGNWIKDNLDSISTIGNGISNLISAKNRLDEINQFALAKQKELKAFKYKTWKDKYLSNLQNQTDRSDIVNAHNAFNLTNINDALQEKLNEINSLIANLLYLNNLQDTGLGDITSGLLGIATNILLGTAKKKDNTFSPLANQTMSQIRGKLLDINANFSE